MNNVLAFDVGNTQTVVGLFSDGKLAASWRVSSSSSRSSDELGVVLVRLLDMHNVHRDNIAGAIIASVVPPLTGVFEKALKTYLHCTPLVVGPGIRTGVQILYESPKDVGADRIVNAIAAYTLCHDACIVVDFGTATTLDCVAKDGSYLGGVIAPGASISLEALVTRAAKLPRIEIEKPLRTIGQNTVESMQAGIYYGYLALIEGLIVRVREAMTTKGHAPVKVYATGGISSVFSEAKGIDEVLPNLTLEGLRILYERNQ